MRKIIVLSMITLDGVMQAPGGPGEDTSGGFEYGGWVAPFIDDVYGDVLQKQLVPADYLLGRKTFEIFEGYWPHHNDFWPWINEGTKYVLSTTRTGSSWNKCEFIKSVEEIRKLKEGDGRDIQVHGSGELVQLLFKYDLIDELWMKIHPITIGYGKKFFDDGVVPAAFELTESTVSTKGVILANYKRAGDVQTGTVGE